MKNKINQYEQLTSIGSTTISPAFPKYQAQLKKNFLIDFKT